MYIKIQDRIKLKIKTGFEANENNKTAALPDNVGQPNLTTHTLDLNFSKNVIGNSTTVSLKFK